MRVVQFNTELRGGGATNASFRLHEELRRRGHDARLIVGSNNDATIREHIDTVDAYPILRRLMRPVVQALGLNYLDNFNTFKLNRHPWLQPVDTVLHLHNLHGSWFNYLALPGLLAGRTAVLTLHDMWAFTGHCVYSYQCERWRTGCGKCPSPDTYPAIKMDNTRLEHWLKRTSFGQCKLIVASPSKWLTDIAQQSFLGRFPVHHIPNGIDTDIYKPADKAALREKLGLPQDKHILLFGCAHVADIWRKGGDMLGPIITKLPEAVRANCFIALFGFETEKLLPGLSMPGKSFGFLSSDQAKANLYAASDVLLFPSRSDNLPFVPMEAMACGLPTIGFDSGGMAELIVEGRTGCLVKAFETAAFAAGVEQMLIDKMFYAGCVEGCRQNVLEHFSVRVMAERYLKLYAECLGTSLPLSTQD